jgi:hypothetical protein
MEEQDVRLKEAKNLKQMFKSPEKANLTKIHPIIKGLIPTLLNYTIYDSFVGGLRLLHIAIHGTSEEFKSTSARAMDAFRYYGQRSSDRIGMA